MGLDGGRKWRIVNRLHLLLRRAAEEEAVAQAPEGEPKVHHMAHGHKGDRDDDQEAKGLWVWGQNHHDEVQKV